jgi:hypothetical protein
MKNSNENIGKGTRDLPVRGAVFQPTGPPRAPLVIVAILVAAGSRSNFDFKSTDATVNTVDTDLRDAERSSRCAILNALISEHFIN